MATSGEKAVRFYEARAEVGKGGIWDPDSDTYYYVDILKGKFHALRLSDLHREDFDVGTPLGAMALIEGGSGLVMAVADGFGIWDFAKKKLEMVATPYGVGSGWRMNDGACDSQGRFWAGRLFMEDETRPGEVYRLENDGKTATCVIKDISCTNGVLWSPDNTLMYCGDSTVKKIFVWDFNEKTGDVTNKRVFLDTANLFEGVPDGASIDQEGYLWVCVYGGHKLVRISPKAEVDRVYDMPVLRPTQPVWYGPALDRLLITSASRDVDLGVYPESGNILQLNVGDVRGALKRKFKLSKP